MKKFKSLTPLQKSGAIGFVAAMTYAYAGAVGNGSTFNPGLWHELNSNSTESAANWPLIITGLYSAITVITLMTSSKNRESLERKIAALPPEKSSWKRKYLQTTKWVVENPIQSQAMLNMPAAFGFFASAYGPGGDDLQKIAGLLIAGSLSTKIIVKEPEDRPKKNMLVLGKELLKKNPYQYYRANPLQVAVTCSILAQLCNMAAGAQKDSPIELFVGGCLVLLSFAYQMFGSMNQNKDHTTNLVKERER